MNSFFTDTETKMFDEILNLILPFYYKQTYDTEQKNLHNLGMINIDFINKPQLKTSSDFLASSRSSFAKSEMGTS